MSESGTGHDNITGSVGRIPGPVTTAVPTRNRLWAVALAAGVVATALTWAAGEASVGHFPQKTINPMAEKADSVGYNRVVVKNATLSRGLQGALLGLTLGIAGALARRSQSAAASAGIGGLVTGGVVGAAAAFACFSAYFRIYDSNSPDLIPSLLSHVGAAAALGAAGGMAFGLGLGGRDRVARAAVGGLTGAALGAALYQIAGAVLFSGNHTGEPVADSVPARLLSHALINLFTAVGAAAVIESPRPTVGDRTQPSE